MNEAEFYQSVGGTMVARGDEVTWNFGWLEPPDRTPAEVLANDALIAAMPPFQIQGPWRQESGKAVLWEFSRKLRNGRHLQCFNQDVGSCFPPGVPVRMAGGGDKPVEEVTLGDLVITHTGEPGRVTRTFRRLYTGDMVSLRVNGMERPLVATADHQIATPTGVVSAGGQLRLVNAEPPWNWISAEHFECGNFVFAGKVDPDCLRSIRSVVRRPVHDMPVYDFEVKGNHSFVANGVVVHNCVGQGKSKVEWQLMYVEVVRLGDNELPIMPYEPFGYAQSRVCAGISGNSDGSTGTGAAEAAKKYGVLRSDLQGLPPWREEGETVYWPGNIDKAWGRNGAPTQWLEPARKHVVQTTALMRSAEDVATALQNGYPCTCASNWGGMMQCRVQGEPGVLLNRRSGQWAHQMCVLGWWDHPTLGEIFYIQNSWSEKAHGTCPSGAPLGGFWIQKSDMASIVGQRETFAYSQFVGFPAPEPKLIPWIFA